MGKVTEALTGINPLGGSVMKVSGKKVYVNVGSEQGVKVGDTYVIYREGESLVDPTTGDILGVEMSSVSA